MDYTLQPYPKYGENHIEKDIVFDTDKRSPTFGCPYYYTTHHKMQERNRFLYKLANDLESDSIGWASRSLSSYSTLSYNSNFAKYYGPMPSLYVDVNDESPAPRTQPPKEYGFVKRIPPFERRNSEVQDCAAMLRIANQKLLPGQRKLAKLQKTARETHPQADVVKGV
jgi:hypothetical protein